MNKYLIFADCDGDNNSPECNYGHYYICQGDTEEEALNDWYKKVESYMQQLYQGEEYKNYVYNKRKPCFTCNNGNWYESGYLIQIVHLKESEDCSPWKKLKWV